MEALSNINIDFIGKRNIAIICSFLIIIAGIVSIAINGGLNYGIDFAGGTLVQVKFDVEMTADLLRETLSSGEFGTFTIQSFGDSKNEEFLIRLPQTDEKAVEETAAFQVADLLEKKYPDQYTIRRSESVGPTMGKELRKSALGAITGAIIMILIYITFRFEFKYAVGATAALIHDVLITVGIFSIAGREFNLPVVAALLTIVGYSLNDTIVVYDRIRENMRLLHRQKYIKIINSSINQTLSRTLLTSLTTLFVVLSLFFFGGEVINDFSFALLIGIIVGTYSSIFVASPILVWWRFVDGTKKAKSAVSTAKP